MVFNPKKAPKSESEFLEWYHQQTEWSEDHSYDDPKVTSEGLQNWFMEMILEFPAMNGPHAPANIDDRIDDMEIVNYCIGKDVIYAAFSWSITEKAFAKTLEMVKKHKVGFYDTSGNIWFPNENGNLELVTTKVESKPWWKFWE